MTTHTQGITATTPDATVEDSVYVAAWHMYEAELALHDARGSHVDAWIAAAAEKLHQAVVEHRNAIAERHAVDIAA
jgi:hypothetical protein